MQIIQFLYNIIYLNITNNYIIIIKKFFFNKSHFKYKKKYLNLFVMKNINEKVKNK